MLFRKDQDRFNTIQIQNEHMLGKDNNTSLQNYRDEENNIQGTLSLRPSLAHLPTIILSSLNGAHRIGHFSNAADNP
jgi:hypothetical protein